jgi:hypothetical protein
MHLLTSVGTRFCGLAKACVRSWVAWLFVAIHAAWFFLAIASMAPPSPKFGAWLDANGPSTTTILAGRPFHFAYQSHALQLLFLLDMPSFLAGAAFALLLIPFDGIVRLGAYEGSYFAAATMLLFASAQWLVVGSRVETRLRRDGKRAAMLDKAQPLFILAIFLITLLAVVLTPRVNARSRHLWKLRGSIPAPTKVMMLACSVIIVGPQRIKS